jgi:hypothetical protein
MQSTPSIGNVMKTHLSLAGDAQSLKALARFLGTFETLSPEPVCPPKAIRGDDNIIYVEVGYRTEEDTFRVGDRMAEVGADILEDTGVLVVLAPFVVEAARQA